MSSHTQETYALPSPFDIIGMPPMEALALLKKLHDTIMNLLEGMPTRTASATQHMIAALKPYLQTPDMRHIHLVTSASVDMHSTPRSILTLHNVLVSLSRFNTLPGNYNRDLLFYVRQKDNFTALPAECQNAIKTTLDTFEGLQYYLEDLTQFWTAPSTVSPLTIKEYLARAYAAQLQCVCVLNASDATLPFHTITLPCLLATSPQFVSSFLYRLSITVQAPDMLMPINGAFIIARHPDDKVSPNNYCTLYIPGCPLKTFTTLAMLKTFLTTDLLSSDCEPPETWLDQRFTSHLPLHIEEHHWVLTPVAFGEDFYRDQIQVFIDKHRRDIQSNWLLENETNTLHIDKHAEYIIADANRRFANSTTFTNTLIKYPPPSLAQYCTKPLPPEPQPMSSTLAPIKIQVVIHQDLADTATEPSIYETHFSWLKAELETLSGREVLVSFMPAPAANQLANYEYRPMPSSEAVDDWAALLHSERPKAPAQLDAYLLLTRYNFDDGREGVASSVSRAAIAAYSPTRVAAHEIGHLFGANHAHSGVIYDSCWSSTLMNSSGPHLPSGAEAYRFSARNRQNIQAYLAQFD